uniref:uncharacterized protein LOC120327038 n=1 Tax=Styela clava TaxID=7725 RepID=UPI00193938A4|nr:uncharacterized protein LOC120327038 [Styela clava]
MENFKVNDSTEKLLSMSLKELLTLDENLKQHPSTADRLFLLSKKQSNMKRIRKSQMKSASYSPLVSPKSVRENYENISPAQMYNKMEMIIQKNSSKKQSPRRVVPYPALKSGRMVSPSKSLWMNVVRRQHGKLCNNRV